MTTKKQPVISVILPVYNAGKFIRESVESILNQTFDNFEFIIIDDASTDVSGSYLKSITDSRIRYIRNEINSGNYKSRNIGLSQARGKYICVMDADDIALPDRLEKQFLFMENNPQYVVAGSAIIRFNQNGQDGLIRLHNSEEIKVFLLKDNVCTHPTLILRKEILDKYQIRYDENYYYAADYKLMCDISRVGAIMNIEAFLLKYRNHENQITKSKRIEQLSFRKQIQLSQLANFPFLPAEEEIEIHLKLMNGFPVNENQLKQIEKWSNKLLIQNDKTQYYDEEYLYLFLKDRIMEVMKKMM